MKSEPEESGRKDKLLITERMPSIGYFRELQATDEHRNNSITHRRHQYISDITVDIMIPSFTKRQSTIRQAGFLLLILTIFIPVSSFADSHQIMPEDFTYLGAFRLPDGGTRPDTFEYGGNAMTFSPAGDTSGPDDGFSGSLYITGHDRTEEVMDGGKVAEVSIPSPGYADHPAGLPQAEFLQDFTDVSGGFYDQYYTIPRMGLAYVDQKETRAVIHLTWGEHLPSDPDLTTHSWFSPDLKNPNPVGSWYIGDQSHYMVNGYLFEIPQEWADTWTGGRNIATGRFRDGGWAGMGPALFAYTPVNPDEIPVQSGEHLSEVVLLRYKTSEETETIEGALNGYQHPDEWEGGAFLTTSSGGDAVIFSGTKATGDQYWYGWIHPDGPNLPCPETEYADEYAVCRNNDGSPCSDSEIIECEGHNDYRGWWSSSFSGEIIFYDPADLAAVASGEKEPWEPQPYATLNIDEYLFHNPDQVETEMIGVEPQRRFLVGDIAYDRDNQILYLLELYADGAKPVVHLWSIV